MSEAPAPHPHHPSSATPHKTTRQFAELPHRDLGRRARASRAGAGPLRGPDHVGVRRGQGPRPPGRTIPPLTAPLREALAGLIRATVQGQKVGTNLNQAVAALNATGQAPGNLIQYARYAATVIEKLDQIAAKVAQLLP